MTDLRICGVTAGLAETMEAERWPGRRITWALDLSAFAGSLVPTQVHGAFAEAWAAWADVIDIDPVYIADPAQALVRTKFGPIDGGRGILAWSELADGTTTPKHQLFDSSEQWGWDAHPTQRIDLQRVACHEIGHVLGLSHDAEGADALMAPVYSVTIRSPRPRDIARMEMLGYEGAAVVPPVSPHPTPTPTPTPTPPAPPAPGGSPLDKIKNAILDALMKAVEARIGNNPLGKLAAAILKGVFMNMLNGLIPGAAALTLPGSLTKASIRAFIDSGFAFAAKFFVHDSLAEMAFKTLQAIADAAFDAIVEDLRAQNLAVAD